LGDLRRAPPSTFHPKGSRAKKGDNQSHASVRGSWCQGKARAAFERGNAQKRGPALDRIRKRGNRKAAGIGARSIRACFVPYTKLTEIETPGRGTKWKKERGRGLSPTAHQCQKKASRKKFIFNAIMDHTGDDSISK